MSPLLPWRRDGGPSPDELRERRLDDVKQIAERFTYDLGLLIAGHRTRFDEYVRPPVAERIHAAVDPFLASGDAMRPNFGEYGELRVEGDLLRPEQPVVIHIEFEDSSVRETAGGETVSSPRRRIRLTLLVDLVSQTVREYALRPLG